MCEHLPALLTAVASSFQRKEALRLPHPAGAAAGRAVLRLGAGLGPGTGAGLASDGDGNFDLRGLALERFFERDFHVVAEIGAALASAAAALSRHAEQIIADVL